MSDVEELVKRRIAFQGLSFYDLNEAKQKQALGELRKLFPIMLPEKIMEEAKKAVYVEEETIVIRANWVSR